MSKHLWELPALIAVLLGSLFFAPRCGGQLNMALALPSAHDAMQGGTTVSFALSSTAFENGGAIPKKYTCDGADVSPALNWTNAPAGTQSLALIADDPDAPSGTWTHWLIWDIPAGSKSLPEGLPKQEQTGDGARQGKSDFKRVGYGGPCPPPGKPHRYFFKLYALNAKLDLKAGASRGELERAMKEHVLAETQWMGTFGR